MSVYFQALDRIEKKDFSTILSNHDRFLIQPDLLSRLKNTIISNIETATKTVNLVEIEYVQIMPLEDQSNPEFLDIVIMKDQWQNAINDLRDKGYLD